MYPRAAIRAGIDRGRVVARVDVNELGIVTGVTIVAAEPPRYFNQAVVDALMRWKFRPDGEKYIGEIEVTFELRD